MATDAVLRIASGYAAALTSRVTPGLFFYCYAVLRIASGYAAALTAKCYSKNIICTILARFDGILARLVVVCAINLELFYGFDILIALSATKFWIMSQMSIKTDI